jgi:CheY-like chemotaxis protein
MEKTVAAISLSVNRLDTIFCFIQHLDTVFCSIEYIVFPIDPQGRSGAASVGVVPCSLLRLMMPLVPEQTSLDTQEKLVRERLGRELTPREKFYLAMADAVGPRQAKSLILCIDDNEAQLQLRKQILENDGFCVLNARNAAEAIEMLRKTPVSLVLSDHMLSGTTGTELAAELKKVKPDVPVVLYSGRAPASLENVDCFINKTEPVPRFLAIIRDLVNRYWT